MDRKPIITPEDNGYNKFDGKYDGESDARLKEFYESIREAKNHDDQQTPEEAERAQEFGSDSAHYGVNKYPDWKMMAQEIEKVFEDRGIPYLPIKFD